MTRYGIYMVLCLALGAVRAEAQSRESSIRLFLAPTPNVMGRTRACFVKGEFAVGADVAFVLGDDGQSVMTIGAGGVTFVPLSNPVEMLTITAAGPNWSGALPIPTDPALAGWRPKINVVAVQGTTFTFSALIPFGPIIEDSIQ